MKDGFQIQFKLYTYGINKINGEKMLNHNDCNSCEYHNMLLLLSQKDQKEYGFQIQFTLLCELVKINGEKVQNQNDCCEHHNTLLLWSQKGSVIIKMPLKYQRLKSL